MEYFTYFSCEFIRVRLQHFTDTSTTLVTFGQNYPKIPTTFFTYEGEQIRNAKTQIFDFKYVYLLHV
jgi:hypothetical protein